MCKHGFSGSTRNFLYFYDILKNITMYNRFICTKELKHMVPIYHSCNLNIGVTISVRRLRNKYVQASVVEIHLLIFHEWC
jgi:hypothetical protein